MQNSLRALTEKCDITIVIQTLLMGNNDKEINSGLSFAMGCCISTELYFPIMTTTLILATNIIKYLILPFKSVHFIKHDLLVLLLNDRESFQQIRTMRLSPLFRYNKK